MPAASWQSPSIPTTGGVESTGGLKLNQAKRLKQLEKENARLKKIVAEKELDLSILKEVAEGNF